MTSRDPGKIAGAFRRLGDHREENQRRKEYALNNPESEAALHVAASSGRTSRRSPSRVSASQRQQLTGVTEKPDQQGWVEGHSLAHLCFPPDQYPEACGPLSHWRCRCGAVWLATGIAWDEYPTDPSRTAQPLKPERWHYISGGQLEEKDYRAQEGLYDWRPLGPYYVKLYRAMLDTLQGKGDMDWRDMG